MKLLNLCLIILNIFTVQSRVLAGPGFVAVNSAEEVSLVNNVKESVKKNVEEAERKPSPPTAQEIARFNKLAAADRLYLQGDKAAAAKLYRQVKGTWDTEKIAQDETNTVKVFDDPAALSPAGKVYWRNYQQGKEQKLESKIFSALKLLTNKEPEFIPGHIHYAKVLKEYDRETESLQVLDKAVNRYPNEPKLLKAKIDADIAAEKSLDASIAARQFALFNPDLPETTEFKQLAAEYLKKYQSQLRSKITWNAIGNAIAGTVGFALTGNLFGPISAVETTIMLLRGESAIGESTAKQARKQLPLFENEEVANYVTRIGNKVAKASGRDEFKYEFYLVMSDELNAFALPGGKVFVNIGAIMKTDSEAELAGLLAHEISHAALSHGFQLITQGNFTANVVQYIPYVGSTASSLIVLNYSRDMEKQADIFGTKTLVNAGYAADGIRNLMVKLDQVNRDQDNPEPPAWLSSHPDTKARVQYLENLIVEDNLNRYAYEGVSRHREMKKLAEQRWKKYQKCLKKEDNPEQEIQCADNKEQLQKNLN